MAKKTSIEVYSEVLNELRSENRKPVYYFYGEEEFFLGKLQDQVEKLIPDDQKDFNFDLLYGKEISPEKVLSIVRSYPMMAEQRVVILRDFKELSSYTDSDEGYEGQVNDIIPYLKQPNPATLFVCIDSKKPHGNSKIGRTLSSSDHVGLHEFEEIPDYRLPDWIIDWASSRHNKNIKPPAAQMLAQYVGNSLKLLSTEIDKVCTFVDSSEEIKKADVKKIIGLYREYSVFELKDAVMDRDLEESLFIAEQMLQHSKNNTGEIIRTVGFFYSVFSNIWQILRLAGSGSSKREVKNALGISGYYFENLWSEASAYELSEMPGIFEALLDADRASKGFTKLDTPSIFLLLIKRIIN